MNEFLGNYQVDPLYCSSNIEPDSLLYVQQSFQFNLFLIFKWAKDINQNMNQNDLQNTAQFPLAQTKEVTFLQSNPSQRERSYIIRGDPNQLQNQNNIDNLYEYSQQLEEASAKSSSEAEKSDGFSEVNSEIMKQQLQQNLKTLQRLWEYRYVCLTDHALETNNWFKLFSFISEFKQKCIELVKKLVIRGLENSKCIDQIDHRYNLKGNGEEGIYLEDGIIIRMAKVKGKKLQNGSMGFDYNALKALHQEYMSHNILNNLSIALAKDQPQLPRIRVPLSCLVKYMGYTAFCQADSPCQGLETLVHGPTGTIYQYREEHMNMLRIIGQSLNLKQFSMQSSDKKSVLIPFSLTLQLHKISKYLPHQRFLKLINRDSILFPKNKSIELDKPCFYLMNVAKLWPLFIDSDIIKSVGYLRPQVVISSKTPLSNVVFCQVSQKPDPEGELELADACKRVKEDHISNLAKMLDNTTVFLVDSQGIEDLLHEYGINIRYIGSLAEKVNLDFNKKILQTQMIARACKRYFFKTFHEVVNEQKIVGQQLLQEFKECFVDFLNLLFIKSKEGQQLYKNYIYAEINRYYDYKIASYPPEMQGGGILHALCYHFGIKLKIIDYPFFQNLQSIFNVAHILEVHGSAKSYDMDTSQIKQICKKYKEKRKLGKLQECIKELKILSRIHSIVNTEKTEPVGPLPEAYFWTQLSEVYFKMGKDGEAQKYAELALKAIPQKHSDSIRPFQILLKYHSQRKEMNKGVEFYQKSLNFLGYHLGTNHPLTITVYNSFAYEQLQSHDPSKCEKMFLKSLQICQRSLGYTHATSSQILLQLAELPLTPEKKINYYLQGLNVLENLDGGEAQVEKIRRVCMRMAEMYETTGNLEKMIYFAKRSLYWQLQMKGESKQQLHKSVLLLANRSPVNSQECAFVTFYAFRSYTKVLPKASREHLYKLFVSVRDQLIDPKLAPDRLQQRLKVDKVNSMTVTELLRNIISHLTLELPQLILKPAFYKKIYSAIDPEDKKLKASIETFTQIISVIGEDRSEKILTENVRSQ